MNMKQKISLVIGILSSVFWLMSADEDLTNFFSDNFRWWMDWWQALCFSVAVASFAGFFIFKDKR